LTDRELVSRLREQVLLARMDLKRPGLAAVIAEEAVLALNRLDRWLAGAEGRDEDQDKYVADAFQAVDHFRYAMRLI
jgi:hypothetical protein